MLENILEINFLFLKCLLCLSCGVSAWLEKCGRVECGPRWIRWLKRQEIGQDSVEVGDPGTGKIQNSWAVVSALTWFISVFLS